MGAERPTHALDPAAAALRLLSAIEELTARQSIWLRAGNCREAVAVQRRAAPLFARLAELGAAAGTEVLRPRLDRLLAHRREQQTWLVAHRAHLESERRRLAAMQGRARQLRTYALGSARRARQRLDAAV